MWGSKRLALLFCLVLLSVSWVYGSQPEGEVTISESDMQRLLDTLGNLRSEVSGLQASLALLEASSGDLGELRRSYEQRLVAYERITQNLRERIHSFENTTQSLEHSNNVYEQQLEKANAELAQLTDMLASLRQSFEEYRQAAQVALRQARIKWGVGGAVLGAVAGAITVMVMQ